jgi:hypothetical protein
MARRDESVWYALGRALGGAETGLGTVASNPPRRREGPSPEPRFPRPVTGTLAGATGAVLLNGLERWLGRRRPPLRRLLRGAIAGAGAAGILVALRAFLRREDEVEFLDEMLSGAGKGIIYASLMEPLFPGPPILRGSLAGTLDYLVSPTGGVFYRLQALSPARKIPVISILLEAGGAEDDPYLVFLCYGAALGLLYGEPDEDDPEG